MLSPSRPTLKSSGSATGNPRNKCALKPGHSLMDWIRLGNTPGVDLTGFQGRVVPVSGEELAKHNTREDAWLALRGKVYNVTRYMDFHPGGVDELMRGVGSDATKLFDEVHAWVNYQQLLAKCYIGPLKNYVKIDKNLLEALRTKTRKNSLGLPPLPPQPPAEIIPRFDWIQKQSDLTFYFYTKQDCNPGIIAHRKSSKQLSIDIQISNTTHRFDFELHADVDWPPKTVCVNSETGKIELNINKTESALWTTYGTHLLSKVSSWCNEDDDLPFSFQVVSNEKFNHNSFELCLCSANYVIVPAVGFHFSIGATINGQRVTRSYTPVGKRFVSTSKTELPGTCLRFLIKNYGQQGQLSAHLAQLSVDSSLQLSAPRGSFKTKALQQRKEIVLLAAGSGLTPCLSLLEHILSCRNTKIERIILVYFNKTEADIWCNEEIKCIANSDERFKFVTVLSEATTDWPGHKGHITSDLLIDILGKNALTSDTFFGICGPSGFNNLSETCLKELNCKDEDFHKFQG